MAPLYGVEIKTPIRDSTANSSGTEVNFPCGHFVSPIHYDTEDCGVVWIWTLHFDLFAEPRNNQQKCQNFINSVSVSWLTKSHVGCKILQSK